MVIEAYPDGSIALCPDFNPEGDGETYRIERRDGSVFEYSVRNASVRRCRLHQVAALVPVLETKI
jgi:hypothetical protein